MKVSGFTILRNTAALGYPFEESIRSLLLLVDEMVVGVGQGDDETWERVRAIGDPRIQAFRSEWDLAPRQGAVLSRQTNLALGRCSGDWAVYLQADEVLHQDDLQRLRGSLRRHLRRRTEGLLFRYLHFWGSPWQVREDRLAFYPRAVRAVKTGLGIESVGDACGFARRRGPRRRGLIKAVSGARVFHYGWCNPPDVQLAKMKNIRRLFDDIEIKLVAGEVFGQGDTTAFRGTHPAPMMERLAGWPAPAARPRGWRAPAPVQAWLRLVREPRALRDRARPLLPVCLTNACWRAVDLWQRAGT